MTRQKSFKSRVRSRMGKTGESYTTARRNLLPRIESTSAPESIKAQVGSNEALLDRTGRGWAEWFALLDSWGATERTHTEIARWLRTEHQVHSWWAQTLTIGYEQARGMRAPGQQSNGYYAASGSKTVAVAVDRAFAAFADASVRAQWLPDVTIGVRTATAPKTFRADWADGSTRIAVTFTPKSEVKAQVAVIHEKITDADTAAHLKTYWRERLAALKQLLES